MPDNIDIKLAIGLKPEQIINYLKRKGYKISWNWEDTWKEAHTRAFTVAKAMKLDILSDIRNELQKAVDEGLTYQQFKENLKPLLKSKGWWGKVKAKDVPSDYPLPPDVDPDKEVMLGSPWRLRTIYRTNIDVAYASGHYKNMLENAKDRPYWMYSAVLDNNTRPSHRALHGKVFRYDDPIWDKIYPPNGWGCRCSVIPLDDDDLKELKIEQPSLLSKAERDNLLKKIQIDKGWDYNPGKSALDPIEDKIKKLEKELNIEIKEEDEVNYYKLKEIKSVSDLKDVLSDINQQFKLTNNKIDDVRLTDDQSIRMVTDMKGNYWVNENVFQLLKNALNKIKNKEELSVQEEYSLKTLYHELLHNAIDKTKSEIPLRHNLYHYETINDIVAKYKLDKFADIFGYKLKHKDTIIYNDEIGGYRIITHNFTTLLQRLNIENPQFIDKLHDAMINNSPNNVQNYVARLISEEANIPLSLANDLFENILVSKESYLNLLNSKLSVTQLKNR